MTTLEGAHRRTHVKFFQVEDKKNMYCASSIYFDFGCWHLCVKGSQFSILVARHLLCWLRGPPCRLRRAFSHHVPCHSNNSVGPLPDKDKLRKIFTPSAEDAGNPGGHFTQKNLACLHPAPMYLTFRLGGIYHFNTRLLGHRLQTPFQGWLLQCSHSHIQSKL